MNREDGEPLTQAADVTAGLDAYSADNQFIGRVSGYLPTAPESEMGLELGNYDAIDSRGHLIGKRHVMIDGTGTIIQCVLIVEVDSLQVDRAARRVTVPMTVAQIEAMPHRDPNRAGAVVG